MPVLKGVRAKEPADKQSTVRVERRVADCLRQVQAIGGYRTPSELLEAMIVCFCRNELPQAELEFSDEDIVRQRRASADAKQKRRDELYAAGQRIASQVAAQDAAQDAAQNAQAKPPERRKTERRTKTGRAALWQDEGNVDRRTKGNDRRKTSR